MRDLERIITSINNLRHDIKAEAIIGDILENGLELNDIVAIQEGLFKRRFKPDVSHADINTLNNGEEVIEVFITRDGIYDALPEGIFHEHSSETTSAGRHMAAESKKQRLEEIDARKFFLPLENEIFHQRVVLEMEERRILNQFSENLFDDIFPEFYNLDKSLPQKYLSRLVLLLHFSHLIAGKPDLTARILEIIIEENVHVNMIKSIGNEFGGNQQDLPVSCTLNDTRLGVDFVCGQYFNNSGQGLEFVIGPLKNTSVEDYLENGQNNKFLECFYGYFIPVEIDIKTRIKVKQEEMGLCLNDAFSDPVLGYNTVI
jgi:hypothetical protein